MRNSTKVIILLGVSFLLMASGNMAEGNRIHIRSSGCSKYSLRAENKEHSRCIIPSFGKFGKLWIAAEVILFVLVGAAVDIRYTLEPDFRHWP